jgi:PAS domain S-box-containing protein
MSKSRILIVEDEPFVARDIQQQLLELGYEPVGNASWAEEGIALAESLRPDLILMDIHLEGAMDGITAAQIIRDRFSLPVVFLTAFAGEETLGRAKQAEPFGYIIKPFDERDLRVVIEVAVYKHRAETLLKKAREERATILRTSMDGFWLTDDQGRILDVNDSCCRMHGFTRDEMLEMAISDLEADELLENIAAGIALIKKTGSAMFERRHRCKGGGLIDVELSITLLPGEKETFSVFLRDITERKHIESTLHENEDRYRDLVDNSQEVITTYDLEGNFISVNETTIRITGYPREALLKMKLWDLVAPKMRHLLPEYFKALQDHGRIKGIMQIQTAEGETRLWEYDSSIRSEGVTTPVVRGLALDITDRRMAERSLRASEAQLKVILESTDDGILAVDLKGKILKTNRRFAQLWQIPQAVLLEGNDQALLDQVLSQLSDPAAFLKTVQALYASDATDLDLITFKDGRCFERFSSPMLEGTMVTGRVWSFRDITDRKWAESAIQESEAMLREAQLIAGLGSYVLDIPTGIWKSSELLDKLFGIKADFDRSTEGWVSLIHPDDQQMMADYFANAVLGKRGRFDKEYRIIRRSDQALRWVHGLGEIEMSPKDEQLKLHGTIQDITERKQAQEALQQQTHELHVRNDELNRFNRVAVGRELRMIDLKREVNELCERLGEPPRHRVAGASMVPPDSTETPL